MDLINSPKGHEKAKPGEKEDTAIDVEWIETGDGACLAVDWIDHRGLPERGDIKHSGKKGL